MAPLDTDKYLRKLQELREKHAWEVVNQPNVGSRPSGEAYMYAVGFQSGLNEAKKLIDAVLKETEKDFDK